MRKIFLSGAVLALAGCAAIDSPDAIQAAGPYPENYKQIALDYLDLTLVDSGSVKQAQIAAPVAAYSWDLTDPGAGWVVCWRGNARNRMGGYSGMTEGRIMIRNGQAVISDTGEAPYYCGKARYESWPELNQLE